MTGFTQSGDYKLPSAWQCSVANVVLRSAGVIPRSLRQQLIRRHSFYQSFSDNLCEGQQGVSGNKWAVMQSGCDFAGKSVLDIGCAEGFFCRKVAISGAAKVVGVDGRFGTLLCARCLSLRENLPISYEMGVFPGIGFEKAYDVVLCLSVLHHGLATKDVWKVLSRKEFIPDLAKLRGHLRVLRDLTRPSGCCLIEMPYEYDDPKEREEVDLEQFTSELLAAGFDSARRLGSWDYKNDHAAKKDRVLYAAEAEN